MKIDDYRLLVALDEAETLRKAAEMLYISQPAVSQRLKTIENDWGTEIFIRTKKKLIVTTHGEVIINHARKMLKEETNLKEMIHSSEGIVNGNLSIGVSSLIGQTVLPKVLERFVQDYPNVKIQLQVGSSTRIMNNKHDFHVSVIRGTKIMNLTNERLMREKHYFIYPKHKVDQLDTLPMIEFQADPVYLKEIEMWYTELFNKEYAPQIKTDQIATCKALLLSGVGMTVLPEIVAEDINREEFEVQLVQVNEQELLRDTYISFENDILSLPQVSAFITMLKEVVSELKIGSDE
ncbi:LysR family transcriptional regulator [Macrococcus armenti]|uniref:LysR family transcriptional regulator n=1 Tax=Macrococcus armenti TaxID=2875764 RepID=UPI001CCCFDB0|nr:LysR family transcriptional regulator [Macrococcus armenti]UBH09090.1 LysR family transcriptional regulator [Macrococcus armenti]UBH11384.1 LysR family transcriptional regulator [Macrococcus armenti]UBH15870.1 LysR family transcriptional regulator [Macrococcus armenti]UBH18230.1 LysR family transcriptional regulator [Macrococcus armenti]UBH20496.1 LysR family transcriptional regulator [Macrococcus armenti]